MAVPSSTNEVTARKLSSALLGAWNAVKTLFKTGINSRPSSAIYGYTHLGTIDLTDTYKRGSLALDVYAGFQCSHLHCISATFGYLEETTIRAVYSAYAPTDGERGRFKLCYKFAEGHTANSPKIDVWLIDTKSSLSSTRRCACVVHSVAGMTWTDGTQTSTTTLPTNLVDFNTAYPYDVGSSTNYGHVKLYDNVTGSNTDGAPTQNAVKEAIAAVEVGKVKATAKSNNAEYKLLATASASPTSGALTEAVYDTGITMNPSTNTLTADLTGNATSADYVPPRMVAPTNLDISWDSVSWADFCGNGSDSLLQKVFGTTYDDISKTSVVLGRMTKPPTDWVANTGLPFNEFQYCTFIGTKTRDNLFVEFLSNEKMDNAYTQHRITFALKVNAGVISISKSIVSNNKGITHPSGVGSSMQPVYVKSDGGIDTCNYMSWNQARSNGNFQALEPRWYAGSTSGYLPAMAAQETIYFRIDNNTSVGGRYFFAVMLDNRPCSISLRADLWSYGEYHVMVDERNGHANNSSVGIVGVVVKGASSASSGKYHLYIVVKTNVAITANSKKWSLGSTNLSPTVTICNQSEYDADTLSAHEIPLPSSTSLMSTDKWYYWDKPYAYGTGGSNGTAVWINSSGEVQECTNLTAARANYASSAGTADSASTVNGVKLVIGDYGNETNTIYFR